MLRMLLPSAMAMQRPSTRFVPVKDIEQQSLLCVHRVRQGFVEQRTATINRLRGLADTLESQFELPVQSVAPMVRAQRAQRKRTPPQRRPLTGCLFTTKAGARWRTTAASACLNVRPRLCAKAWSSRPCS
jgi:transposase